MVIQHYLLIKRKLLCDQKARGEYQSSISHQLRKHIFAFLFFLQASLGKRQQESHDSGYKLSR